MVDTVFVNSVNEFYSWYSGWDPEVFVMVPISRKVFKGSTINVYWLKLSVTLGKSFECLQKLSDMRRKDGVNSIRDII